MKAEILTIGDEILIGQIVNTNSVWIAQQLNLAGIEVKHMASVSDTESEILAAFEAAEKRADVVFITGGLGPTKDDITKKTFCKYFNCDLVLNSEVLEDVTAFFTKRDRPLNEMNRQQALVPENCTVIRNSQGTAPGMWMKKHNCIFISMPGVPYEMKCMMSEFILPRLKKENHLPFIYHRTVLTQGIGESTLAEILEKWEDELIHKKIKLAYLPQPGMVRLRLSTVAENQKNAQEKIDSEISRLLPIVEKYVYGFEEYGEETPTMEKIVSDLLRKSGKTLALAESCTGGYISSLITSLPGASEIYAGGIVPYSNQAKTELANVDATIFSAHGAVSKECVELLAKNILKKFNADYSVAVSGIAGPSGGSPEKPVGYVWIAVSSSKKTISKSFQFGDHRQRNIVMTANAALDLLRKFIA